MDVVQRALNVFVLHLQIGQGGVATGAPVGDILVAVDQPLLVKGDKDLPHGLGEALVHGEPLPVPVAGGAQAL